MNTKRTLMLACMLLALTAFAAPAAQATAPEWYIHEGGMENKLVGEKPVHIEGTLTAFAGTLISGPCNFTLTGTVANQNGMAIGAISKGSAQANCETSVLGCVVMPTINASEEGPWEVTGATVGGKPGAEVIGLTVTNHYSGEECNLPPEVVTVGTATPILKGTNCLDFGPVKDDLLSGGLVATDLVGEACIKAPLTLK